MQITTFEQYRVENADLFKIVLINSAVEESVKDEILDFINAFPTMDLLWDMAASFDEGVEKWGGDFETVINELAMERERTERHKAYLKIVTEIAEVEDPCYVESGDYFENVCCHFCEASTQAFVDATFFHDDDSLWVRSKKLVEKE